MWGWSLRLLKIPCHEDTTTFWCASNTAPICRRSCVWALSSSSFWSSRSCSCDVVPKKSWDIFLIKNGDLPIENGDLPTKNGDCPIQMGGFSIVICERLPEGIWICRFMPTMVTGKMLGRWWTILHGANHFDGKEMMNLGWTIIGKWLGKSKT